MKYIKYFKESMDEQNGFDMKYINLILALKKLKPSDRGYYTEGNRLSQLLTAYTPTVPYLPNGVWEVKEDIKLPSTRLRSLDFKVGNILYFKDGKIKYSTNRGIDFYNALDMLNLKEELKTSVRGKINDIYLTMYRNTKKIEDSIVFNNIKKNTAGVWNAEVYKMACEQYGLTNVETSSAMTDMGFSD